MRELLLVSIGLILGVVFIIWIWVAIDQNLFSTKLGLVMIIVGMLIHIFPSAKYFSAIKKLNNTSTNKEYLQNLKNVKSRQHLIQTKFLSIYFALLGIGILLHTYEYAMMMPNPWGVVAYAATIAWIAFAWFYLRPKKIKKDRAKLDEIILHYDNINAQFEAETA